jgi:hypothetical protein
MTMANIAIMRAIELSIHTQARMRNMRRYRAALPFVIRHSNMARTRLVELIAALLAVVYIAFWPTAVRFAVISTETLRHQNPLIHAGAKVSR